MDKKRLSELSEMYAGWSTEDLIKAAFVDPHTFEPEALLLIRRELSRRGIEEDNKTQGVVRNVVDSLVEEKKSLWKSRISYRVSKLSQRVSFPGVSVALLLLLVAFTQLDRHIGAAAGIQTERSPYLPATVAMFASSLCLFIRSLRRPLGVRQALESCFGGGLLGSGTVHGLVLLALTLQGFSLRNPLATGEAVVAAVITGLGIYFIWRGFRRPIEKRRRAS